MMYYYTRTALVVCALAAAAAAVAVTPADDSKIVWSLGEAGASCTATCDALALVGECNEQALLTASKDTFAAAGVECTSFNGWDYDQGYSQCTAAGCCDGKCVGACSTPAPKGCDAKPESSSHSRLCACHEGDGSAEEEEVPVTQPTCLASVQALLGDALNCGRCGGLVAGSWSHVPTGCSYQSGGDNAAHWNSRTSGTNNGASDYTRVGVVGGEPPTPPPPVVTVEPTDPFACAKANDVAQRKAFPDWWYAVNHGGQSDPAALDGREPLGVGFEPLLEPVPQCNGLAGDLAGGLKEFRFLVVLDGSWVSYYNSRKAAFAAQGYPTLATSANLMLDRASYIFEAQFGSRISASRVVDFPELGEACATNNAHSDDGSDRTSTSKALRSANIVATSAEAGTLRLGVGSLAAGQYCHSSSPIGGVCSPSSTLTNQQKPFQETNDQINHGAVKTLAHELAHFFGVCDDSNNPDCLSGHTANEIADIMVNDGRPASNVRPVEGMFWKFMTTCTDVYDDMVCSRVKAASPTCGLVIPPNQEPPRETTRPTTRPLTTTASGIVLDDVVCDFVVANNLCDGFCPEMADKDIPDGLAMYACGVGEDTLDETVPYREYCPKQCAGVESCPAQLAALERENAANDATIADLVTESERKSAESEQLKAATASLKSEVAGQGQAIVTLQAEKLALEAEQSQLQTTVGIREETIIELTRAGAALEAEKAALVTLAADKDATIGVLRSETVALESDAAALEAEKVALSSSAERLALEAAAQDARLLQLAEELAAARQTIEASNRCDVQYPSAGVRGRRTNPTASAARAGPPVFAADSL